MRECRRIFTNRRLWVFIVSIFLLNGFLFIREQSARDYGMDLSLAAFRVSLEEVNGYDTGKMELDAKACQNTYQRWLKLYKKQEPEKAAASLQKEEAQLLERADLSEKQYRNLIAIRTLLGQFQYQKDFYAYLQKVQQNKDSALSFSVFNQDNAFTQRNIRKTAAQFEELRGVEISIDNNQALEAFITYKTTDYFLILFLILIAFAFLDERKKGLWSIIYGSKDGRIKLGVRRSVILFVSSAAGTLILYGSNLLLANCIYNSFGDFSRAIQSSQLFMKLPIQTTVGISCSVYFYANNNSFFSIIDLLVSIVTDF